MCESVRLSLSNVDLGGRRSAEGHLTLIGKDMMHWWVTLRLISNLDENKRQCLMCGAALRPCHVMHNASTTKQWDWCRSGRS